MKNDNTGALMTTQEKLLDELHDNSTLNQVQKYIKEVIRVRGFSEETPDKCLLLLTEEIGELAKAVRKTLNYTIDNSKAANYTPIEEEIADVFIVLTSLCNRLNLNLFDCFYEKEKENIQRSWR